MQSVSGRTQHRVSSALCSGLLTFARVHGTCSLRPTAFIRASAKLISSWESPANVRTGQLPLECSRRLNDEQKVGRVFQGRPGRNTKPRIAIGIVMIASTMKSQPAKKGVGIRAERGRSDRDSRHPSNPPTPLRLVYAALCRKPENMVPIDPAT